ncbi:MAG: DegV family protein [Anaerolineales bacterium]|nr:DegV family protein [Anaerolineales bacterium]
MLRIVTDGAADILPQWEKEYGIDVIPVNLLFGEKSYLQGVELDNEGFYKLVDENKKIPKTAQPSPHQFIEFYRKIAQKGDTILSIHITAKLSGTYASATSAAEELKGEFNIIPIDSASGSLGIGLMCREARKMERAGKTLDEILAGIESAKNKIRVILTLDTLEYAKLSGRVGTLQATLASVLNVKPIAVLRDGVVNIVEKVRTRKAALERVISMAKEEVSDAPVYLAVVHARDEKSGQSLLAQAQSHFNAKETMLGDLSVSIAANLGPGTVGLILYPAD